MSLVKRIRNFVYWNRTIDSVPALDGALTPNSELDEFALLPPVWGDDMPDDIAIGGDGSLLVAAGSAVFHLGGGVFDTVAEIARFDSAVTALAVSDRGLYCGLSGKGVAHVAPGGALQMVTDLDGAPLGCVTALSVGADGTVYGCEGARGVSPENWYLDLMSKGASGRIFAFAPGLDSGRVIAGDLRWPAGIVATPRGPLWSESWAARVVRHDLAGAASEIVIPNLPGYPGRLAPARDGGFWLSIFAPRTLLVDFVLKEDEFRAEMMRRIPPSLWIRPALRAGLSPIEPLQGGGIRKLGQQNPWAPPRAYGLAVRLDANGEAVASLHSRVGGACHGVTAVQEATDRLFICSKGHGRIVWRHAR
jgi:hypothetical protein